jgi:uncharacterized protein with HEPN domain
MAPDEGEAAIASRDKGLMLDMVIATEDALSFVADLDEAAFKASRLHQNAVIRSLEIVGEAAGKVSPSAQLAHSEVPWREITGMRHRLIHGYSDVNLNLVWQVVRERLPQLLVVLSPLVRPNES